MSWLLVVLLVLLALAVLGFTSLSLWRAVQGLTREVARAGSEIGGASDALAQRQAATAPPPPAVPTGSRARRR